MEYIELYLKDWGPISEASLRIKPLTILIGPNNTGKSYASLTLYAMLRSLREALGLPRVSLYMEAGTGKEAVEAELRDIGEALGRFIGDVMSSFINAIPVLEEAAKGYAREPPKSLEALKGMLDNALTTYVHLLEDTITRRFSRSL